MTPSRPFPSRVILYTPYWRALRGNSISAQRLAGGLQEAGLDVEVKAFLEEEENRAAVKLTTGTCLIHGLHAYKFGSLWPSIDPGPEVPLVLNITGTDLNHDLFHPDRRRAVLTVLQRADRVVVYHPESADFLAHEVPNTAGKIAVIPQSAHLPPPGSDLRRKLGLKPDDFVFAIPAGIRKVKNVSFALEPLADLYPSHRRIRFLAVGPALENDEFRRLDQSLARLPWAQYLGGIPHEQMSDLYLAADVVLNTSLSEGQPQAILEAMSLGRPVLVSDIPGNRALVTDGDDGFVYSDTEDFKEKAYRLLSDPDLRRRLGNRARQRVERDFSYQREITSYLELYRQITPGIR